MNLKRNWVLEVDGSIYKFLSKIPRQDAARILVAIEDLPNDPFFGDIQKMKGEENVWRRRVGSYRFRYELVSAKKVIRIFFIERKTS